MKVTDSQEAVLEHMKQRKDIEALDSYVFKQMVVDNTYGLHKADVVGRRVLDIGAHVGIFSTLVLEYGAKQVVAVDPSSAAYFSLSHISLKPYIEDGRDISIIKMAAYDKSLPYANLVNEAGALKCTKVTSSPGEKIKTTTLNELLQYFPPNDKDLVLKMDINGTEKQVIENSTVDDLRRFKTILIDEYHGNRINEFIQSSGYVIDWRMFYWAGADVNRVSYKLQRVN